jgi:hypothetical protein
LEYREAHTGTNTPLLATIAAWEAWPKPPQPLAQLQLPTAIAPAAAAEKYIEGLKKGSYAFNWTISGHEAARQLGFGRRFAVMHGQAVEEVRARLTRKSSVHIDEIIEYLVGCPTFPTCSTKTERRLGRRPQSKIK